MMLFLLLTPRTPFVEVGGQLSGLSLPIHLAEAGSLLFLLLCLVLQDTWPLSFQEESPVFTSCSSTMLLL